MTFTINELTEHKTGAEITDLDLSEKVGYDLKAELNAALAKFHVLVFRNQKLSPSEFSEAGKIFGEILPQHHKQLRVSPDLEVYHIRNEEIAPGKYLIAGESFHTDHSNYLVPPKATALHAVSLPSVGGDTQFVNMHSAYNDLPDSMRKKVEKLEALHVFQSKYSPRELRKLTEESKSEASISAFHRLVRVHPENHKKFLYLNPVRMESITGIPDVEALALIAELMKHATQNKYEYRHKWRLGDMVIWDNRSVMHQANGDYDMSEKRHLYRLMVKGNV